jgi:NAD(P)-dependent dehydrogenase (short-subunit alcohol dehydrogenase family)
LKGNGGIGLELASQLLADSTKHVLLGSRSVEKGQAAVKELQSQGKPGTVELVQVDVASEASIAAAAKDVEAKHGRYTKLNLAISMYQPDFANKLTRLDALVNNAAVATSPGSLAKNMSEAFQTNVIGPLLMVEAFAPLLQKSTGTPRIINVTSGLGSITLTLDSKSSFYGMKGIEPYQTSKAALNMVTATQVVKYGDVFKIFLLCPGFTVSNLGPHNTAESGAQPTSAGAAPMVDILNGNRDAEHGGFLNATAQYPW